MRRNGFVDTAAVAAVESEWTGLGLGHGPGGPGSVVWCHGKDVGYGRQTQCRLCGIRLMGRLGVEPPAVRATIIIFFFQPGTGLQKRPMMRVVLVRIGMPAHIHDESVQPGHPGSFPGARNGGRPIRRSRLVFSSTVAARLVLHNNCLAATTLLEWWWT